MRKAYILTFDKGGWLEGFDYKAFHDQITKDPAIVSWWHYLENTYIFITEPNIRANYFREIFLKIGNKKFVFVCELDLNDCDGWMPIEAWEWINKYKAAKRYHRMS